MGTWSDLWKPLDLSWVASSSNAKGKLVSALENAENWLTIAEAFVDDVNELRFYREKIGETIDVIALPDIVVKNYTSATKIIRAVSDLRGDIRRDPKRAARTFGRLFSETGELPPYLPFPISSYLEIFAAAENFFGNIRAQMDPEVHMREPGIRDVIRDLP